MKRILVLGSEGQIGKPLCKYLRETGCQVTGVDLVNSPGEDLRVWNTLNRATIKHGPFDFCHFLAWDVGGSRYLEKRDNSQDLVFNNMRIMLSTFEYLKTTNLPFLFYTSQMSNMVESAYGLLKNIGEKLTLGLESGSVIKLWNVYGPESDPTKFHVITDFLRAAEETGEIRMLTAGTETRRFLYVGDLVNAVHQIQESHSNFTGKIIDYSAVPETKIIEVARICAEVVQKHTGKKINVIPGDRTPNQVGYGNEPKLCYDLFRLPQPQTNLETGIERIYLEMKCQTQTSI